MLSRTRVYGTKHNGTPTTDAYDEHASVAEAQAALWAWSAFPANELEQYWIWNGEYFVGCRSLAGKRCPSNLAEAAAYHYVEIEAGFIDAYGEMGEMERVCRI